jgi:tetratricopeptide (TPR) repeat protein
MKHAATLVIAAALLAGGCLRAPAAAPVGPRAEATSLLGQPLYAPVLAAEAARPMEARLEEARAAHARDPGSADAAIWHGRRAAYLGRYRDAIAIYTDAIRRNPRDPRLYRHRGHRYLSVREFDAAARDLHRAARLMHGLPEEVEPDGLPNPAGVPRTTLQFNVHYHLGLAHYLRGDFPRALAAFRGALAEAGNDDALVAATDWAYMTLRRLGRHEEAGRLLEPIHRDMEILENDAYLRRLLMYRGEVPVESLLGPGLDDLTLATQGYAVGNWHLVHGRAFEAEEVFRRITAGSNWAAFGYIAAEADLARLARRRP